MSEEWWKKLKSTNKIAYKFKTKPLEHEDLMCEVFTGAIATRKHHWTPNEKVADVGNGESNSIDSLRLQPFTDPYKLMFDSPLNSPSSTLMKQTRGQRGRKGIVQRIMAIPDFISTPVFHFACITLEKIDYREILMCMLDDENVIRWLAALKASKGL
ncbi:hypothetical protein ACSBR2_001692 [Camellia fascicularis]